MNSRKGIVDTDKNPFARKDWIKQGYSLTDHRRQQLRALFGKTVQEISQVGRNEGRYPAFVAIRWGFARIKDGKLARVRYCSK